MNDELQAATAALLRANSVDELDQLIVDLLPKATGFERMALLSVPNSEHAAQVLRTYGDPALTLGSIPKDSPLAPSGYLDKARSGNASDDDVPHANVDGSYIVAPIRDRNGTVALLYADALIDGIEPAAAARALEYALEVASLVRVNLSLTTELAALARTDPLTGLPNRRVFDESLERELRRSARSRRPFALVMLDIDKFEATIDNHGQQIGDEALRAVAMALRNHARHADLVARFGESEFAMLLIDADRGAAHLILERMLQAIRAVALSAPVRLTASAGVALSFPVDTPESIVERADAALYTAKRAGPDCARFV